MDAFGMWFSGFLFGLLVGVCSGYVLRLWREDIEKIHERAEK
jgi:fructose-specific phosphotransferase system IIC component